MNTTLINVADAKPGMVVLLDDRGGDAVTVTNVATVTKAQRPRGADFLRITLVDDLGSVFTRKFYDGPTPWTITIQA